MTTEEPVPFIDCWDALDAALLKLFGIDTWDAGIEADLIAAAPGGRRHARGFCALVRREIRPHPYSRTGMVTGSDSVHAPLPRFRIVRSGRRVTVIQHRLCVFKIDPPPSCS